MKATTLQMIAASVATFALPIAPAHAGTTANQQQQAQVRQRSASWLANRPYRPPTADQEFHSDKLTAPVSLPGLPPYTGRAQFITGLRYPYDSTGQRIGMTFGTTEEPDQVLDWYRSSLKMYNWTMVPDTSDPNLIAGHLSGNSIGVRVIRSTSPSYRSEIVISYKCGK